MAASAGLFPDLDHDERALSPVLARLGAAAPPARLRARILDACAHRPGRVLPRGAGWGARGLVAAAAILLGVGVQSFARAAVGAVRPDAGTRFRLAVVEDPGLSLFAALEPGGGLGPDEEGVAVAGR